ncbi:MAG TPA: DNA repair protein RecN [Firmicutes bacterium]|nr:DNA repair protein RecN [Candidatus Fermentithermobacillaceae bacterium]
MLTYLRIRNFGIFDDIDIELGPGLTVFTGETGAGKSMIVDAVTACLGYRTSPDTIRSGERRAILELLISPPEPLVPRLNDVLEVSQDVPEIMIQRDILAERSYMRINGRIATMSMAQTIGSYLVDIHGQQDHHSLLKPQNNLSMLDQMIKGEISVIKREYHETFLARQDILRRSEQLNRDASQRRREIDLLSHQVDEIDKADLRRDEEEELKLEYRVLSSQRNLIELAQEAYERLHEGFQGSGSAYDQLTQSIFLARKIAGIDPSGDKLVKDIEQVLYALEVAVDTFRDYQRRLQLDPSRLKQVEARLDLIERLKAKYGSTIDQILDYKDSAAERLAQLLNADEILRELNEKLGQIESKMVGLGKRLSATRRETSVETAKQVSSVLEELGIPGAEFVIALKHQADDDGVPVDGKKIRAFADGFDLVEFLFSANPGETLLPIHKVASGGELSRLMLAIKTCMEGVSSVPTLIFDEIDAGVGGKAGQAIGEKLWQLSRNHQVLCVTHLASIAAMADTHFVVNKYEKAGRTYAEVAEVREDHRARELARMLSGTEVGVSLDHGRELLAAAKQYKQRARKTG